MSRHGVNHIGTERYKFYFLVSRDNYTELLIADEIIFLKQTDYALAALGRLLFKLVKFGFAENAELFDCFYNKLAHLGNRPLGEIIFSYPKLERVAMDVSLIKPQTWTDSALIEADIKQEIWGRRTVYGIAHHQMLVNEFFLPSILERV